MNFNEMKLMKQLLQAIEEQGYVEPSPIQKKTIPLVLEGKDILGCAQTGTGKTAAFALPILERLSKETNSGLRALIITPTRELAIQIYENFECYGKYTTLKQSVIFGGVGQSTQVNTLKAGVDILIATPGRLNDLIGQGYIKLDAIEMFVLDEADQMLDMGFLNDIKKVIKLLPQKRQTLLFSATMPDEIESLATGILNNPEIIKVSPVTSTVDAIEQSVYFVDRLNKIPLLTSLIKSQKMSSVLVFTKTKHGADRVADKLNKAKVKALAIHGGKAQNTRQTALSEFKEGKIKVLVATDIAARGIDISELSYVVNYDIPSQAEVYIHRIGRTGRAGLGGNAINLCNIDDLDYLRDIEKHIGKIIPEVPSKWPMLILEKTEKPVRGQKAEKSARGQKTENAVKNEAKDLFKSEVRYIEKEARIPHSKKKFVAPKKDASNKLTSAKKKMPSSGNKKSIAEKKHLKEKKPAVVVNKNYDKKSTDYKKKTTDYDKKSINYKKNADSSKKLTVPKDNVTYSEKKPAEKGKNKARIAKKHKEE